MDALLAEMDGRVKVSLTDSTMMKIVRLAMDRAQEKLMSKHGVLGRLIEISKFYELAVMQLEGCLKFVQEETDGSNLEGWHEHVLDDLSEIRDRLRGRLEETERTIMAKDKELRERVELELKLRHALQMKERELVCLRAKLQAERSKSEGAEEMMVLGNRLSVDEGQFSELMQLVDQQVSNIEQRLELEPEFMFLDDQDRTRSGTIDNKKVEQMGSDIHILKETFNLAFGKMQNAIMLSEMEPTEQQWRWTVEESVFCITVKGLVRDLQDSIGDEVRKMEYQVSEVLSEHLSNLMSEMTSLRCELESLTAVSEDQARKIPPKVPPLSSKVSDADLQNEVCKEEDGGNFVAKMVKSHESFIRKKSQELNWLKIDGPQEEGQTFRRHRGADDLKRRIQEMISRLDNLISWNAKMGETLLTSSNVNEREKSGNDTMEDVWEKIHRGSVPRPTSEELQNEISRLKQENEDMGIQQKVMEEIYGAFLRSSENEFQFEICSRDLGSLVIEGVWEALYREMVSGLKEELESNKIESQIAGDVNRIVFSEAMESYDHYIQDFSSVHEVFLRETINEWKMEIDTYNELIHGKEVFRVLEGSVKEDVCKIFLRETVNEWKMEMEAHNMESLIRQEIHQFIVGEILRDASIFRKETESLNQAYNMDENLNQQLDSLDKILEVEEDAMAIGAGSEIKKGEKCLELVILERDLEEVHDQLIPISDREVSFCKPMDSEQELNPLDLVFLPLLEFSRVMEDFQCMMDRKIGSNMCRLEVGKRCIDSLGEHAVTLRKSEALYKDAFIRRCQNLHKAEAEVDLLGDQVDELFDLLKKIYKILQHYSPVLQQYTEVSDMVRLIKKVLVAEV